MKYVKARTHGPEYSWHKYWSRKPASVINAHLESLVPKGGFVVDPFSGSGVVLREATKLGFSAAAFDVNPIAVAISEFMITDLDREQFVSRANEVIDSVELELGHLFVSDGKQVRFLVHRVVSRCAACGEENVYDSATHGVLGKKCISCKSKVSFGLSSLVRTEISEIQYSDGTESLEPTELSNQNANSQKHEFANSSFDAPLVDNRRTLTSSQLSVKNYFTPRNFSILSRVAEIAHAEAAEDLKKALLLMVTASSAQASRLIASRGKLAGGGQAWTIPGFWVPPVHLESNPFIHLRARLKKMDAALREIQSNSTVRGKGSISRISAQRGLRELAERGELADLIFMDPPYGDSVAFLEFSAIWNAFLSIPFDYLDDISVSDRVQEPVTMQKYEEVLKDICARAHSALKNTGKVLLTFNNHDLSAWRAIVGAFQTAGFRAIDVRYQDPSVVSAKSQTALDGSYVGDFYVVFQKSNSALMSFEASKNHLSRLLVNAASVRNGLISKGMLLRFGLQEWLSLNVDASEIHKFATLLDDLFVVSGKKMSLRNPSPIMAPLTESLSQLAHGFDLNQASDLERFAAEVESKFRSSGSPSIAEALAILGYSKSEVGSKKDSREVSIPDFPQ